jgi:ubiquinone/menaquinone biosynthesis C-methylase UbiE
MVQNPIEAAKARTIRAFEEMAPDYDQSGPAFFTHFGKRLVDVAGIRPGDRVLDVATGRGAVLLPAAAAVTETGSVSGIDLTEAMVRATTADLERRQITNASVQIMDAEQLDFSSGAFDAVLCGFGVMFFPRLQMALAEFRRVLTPGGTLAVSTFRLMNTLTPAIEPILREHEGAIQRPLTQQLATTDELHEALAESGFEDVKVRTESFEAIYPDEDVYWTWAMSLLPGVWLRRQPAEVQARFKEDAHAHLRTSRQPDGIHESITALIATARR